MSAPEKLPNAGKKAKDLNEVIRYTLWSVFKLRDVLPADRAGYADEVQELFDQLAAKEMEIGRFYLEKRSFPAAINRFRDVVSKYQTTRHTEEALERLVEAYMALGITAEAQNAAAVLGHNFPDSPWYKDAYALLQTGGLEPREEKSSWLSRAFRSVTGQKTASVD